MMERHGYKLNLRGWLGDKLFGLALRLYRWPTLDTLLEDHLVNVARRYYFKNKMEGFLYWNVTPRHHESSVQAIQDAVKRWEIDHRTGTDE